MHSFDLKSLDRARLAFGFMQRLCCRHRSVGDSQLTSNGFSGVGAYETAAARKVKVAVQGLAPSDHHR
jgi:hypothetical protein